MFYTNISSHLVIVVFQPFGSRLSSHHICLVDLKKFLPIQVLFPDKPSWPSGAANVVKLKQEYKKPLWNLVQKISSEERFGTGGAGQTVVSVRLHVSQPGHLGWRR